MTPSFCVTFGGSTRGCAGTMDSDMVLGRSQVWMSPLLQRTEQATQTGTVPVEVWPSGSNKAQIWASTWPSMISNLWCCWYLGNMLPPEPSYLSSLCLYPEPSCCQGSYLGPISCCSWCLWPVSPQGTIGRIRPCGTNPALHWMLLRAAPSHHSGEMAPPLTMGCGRVDPDGKGLGELAPWGSPSGLGSITTI